MAAYFDSDQPAKAAQMAEAALAQSPDDKKLQMNLVSIYMQAGQDDKAITLMEKMRAQGKLTEDREYRNLYALYMNSDGHEKEGIAVIKEGLDKGVLKPDYQTYLALRSEEHTSELQSLMRISYAVFCLKKKTNHTYALYSQTKQ